MGKRSEKFKIKVCCPYCHRISTIKNLAIGGISAVCNNYYFEDIQCNLCGSYYDLRMDFHPSICRQRAIKRAKDRDKKKVI